MKRFFLLASCLGALCVCALPSLLTAQTWVNGQPATWVIGQSSFNNGGPNNPTTMLGVANPEDIAVGNNKLFVVDRNNHRVLRYGLPLTSNQPTPEVVFGQGSFAGITANNGGVVGNIGFNNPVGVAYNAVTDELWVADFSNNRVLRFAMAATLANGTFAPMANLVVGQANFTSNAPALTQNGLNTPFDVAVDATNNIYVTDYGNRRILQYDAASLIANGPNASKVFGGGVLDYLTAGGTGIPTNRLNDPSCIVWQNNGVNGGTLYVTDPIVHRVLCFDNIGMMPTFNNPASRTIGISGSSGATNNQMNIPVGLALDGDGRLYVNEEGNRRILIYNNVAANAANTAADNVLGQQVFGTNFTQVSRTGQTTGRGIAAVGAGAAVQIFASDNGAHRILQYDIGLPTLNTAAPLLDANNQAPTQAIQPTFSQAMNIPNATNFRAFGGMTGLKAGMYAGGAMPSFTPTAPYQRGERVEYTITTGATLGNGLTSATINKPYLNGLRPLAPATPFVGSFRVSAAVPPGGVNFVLSTYATIGGNAVAIAPADYDGDGYVDFAAASVTGNRIAVRRNYGMGNFAKTLAAGEFLDLGSTAILDLKAADMNNDGLPDWVYIDAGQVYIQRNTSTPGNLSAIAPATGIGVAGLQKLTTGDFDGDGDIDVAVITSTPELIILRNNFPTFSLSIHSIRPLPATPTCVATGDLNSDGSLDIAVGFTGNNILTYHNDGGGSMIQTPVNNILPGIPVQLATGSIDNMPGTDIVAFMPGAPSRIYVLPNTALGSFASAIPYTTPGILGTVGGIALGDIDGSGSLDVVSASLDNAPPATSRMAWFRNDGLGVLGAAGQAGGTVGLANSNASCITLCDVDQDGDLDALVGFGTGAAFPYVAVLRNEQPSTVNAAALSPLINAQNIDRMTATANIAFNHTAPVLGMTTGTATVVNFLPDGSGPIRIFGNMTGGRNRVGGGGSWLGNIFTPTNLVGPSAANRFHPGELVSVSIPNFQTNAAKNDRFVPITSGTATNIGGHVRQFRTNAAMAPGIFTELSAITPEIVPFALATADFDNNGRVDIVTVNRSSGSISVFLNTGTPTFGAAANYAVGMLPQSVVTGDVDNDGDIDLVIGNFGSNNLTVWRNNGMGVFVTPINYPCGTQPTSLTLNDLDGDGDLDIAVANQAPTNNVNILLNNGLGAFTAGSIFSVAADAFSVSAADFNGDGDMDLAVSQGNFVSVLSNNGQAVFTLLGDFAVGTTTFSSTVGDFDGDGRPDIVAANNGSNNISILRNNMGTGFFMAVNYNVGAAPLAVSVGDIDGDSDLDILVGHDTANEVQTLINTGGNFALLQRINPGTQCRAAATGDFDNDGDLDLVVTNGATNLLRVYLNARPPRINPIGPALPLPIGNRFDYQREVVPQRNSHTQAFGTFPVQIRFDQAVTSATASFPMVLPPSLVDRGAIRIHGSMTGHRSTPSALGTWNYIAGTNTAEYIPQASNPFRAGETVMVTVTNAQASTPGGMVFSTSPTVYAFTVAPSGGTGRFVDSRRYDDAGSSQSVALADFDLDGRIDMMQASSMGLNLRLQNNPLGNPTSFANGATNIVAGNITHALAADFDSDGRPDVAYIVGTNIVVRRNDPLGAFGTVLATIPSGTAGLNKLAVADFDGDGDMDIALAANSIRVFLNNGSATAFTLAVNTAFVANSIAALDADMDGDIDLVITNPPSTLVYLNRGSAPNLFSATADFTLATSGAQEIAFGDFNSDTYPDLAIGELGTNNLFVLMNQADGTGNFMPATAYNTGSSNSIPVVGRFDGDNILDIAIVKPNNADSKIMLYRGNGAGLFELVSSSAFMESTNVPFNALMLPQAADIDGDGDLDLAIPLLNGNRTAILYNHQPELKVQATSPLANASSVALPVGITTIFNQNVTNNTATLPPTGPLRVFGSMTGGRARIGGGTWSSPAPPINQATFSANLLGASTIRYYPGEKIEFVASTNTYVQGSPGVANTVPMTTGTVRQFTVRAGLGPGTFFELTRYLAGISNAPEQTLLVDVNNDGRLDLITLSVGIPNFHVQLGNGNGTFGAPATVPVGGLGYRMASGDFDNDGDVDLVITQGTDIRIFTNTAGAFTAGVVRASNAAGGSLFPRVSDVNGDGILDIVTSNQADNANPFSIMFGIGGADFRVGVPLPDATGYNTADMELGDVDNDGDIDVIIATNNVIPANRGMVVYKNDGIGRFGTAPVQKQVIGAGVRYETLDVADIDNDGDLDIVGTEFLSHHIRIFPNNPLGTFSVGGFVGTVAGSNLRSLRIADVNGDTRPDVVVSSSGDDYIAVVQNTGVGFSAPSFFRGSVTNPRVFALGDIDGDGDLDLVSPNRNAPEDVTVFLNATQPRFVCNSMVDCGPPTYTPMISPQRNVNNAVTSSLFTWQFTEPMTTATASFPTAAPPAGTDGPIRVFGNMRASRSVNGGGSGTWTYTALAPNTTATLAPARAMLPGEEMMVSVTNARAVSGIAVRPYVYGFRARAGVGPGTFSLVDVLPKVDNFVTFSSTELGDLDNDGDLDIVATNTVAISSSMQTGVNTNTFTTPLVVTAYGGGANHRRMRLADVNNDGFLDAVIACGNGTQQVLVRLGDGTGAFPTLLGPFGLGGGLDSGSPSIGDIDGDGDLDVVIGDFSGTVIHVMKNNGLGTFAPAAGSPFAAGATSQSTAVVDVDNDGDMDIVALNATQLIVLVNDGNGNFTQQIGSPFAMGSTAGSGLVAADMNGDGFVDVAFGDNSNVHVRLNNGTGTAWAASTGSPYALTGGGANITVADVNGDGTMDINALVSTPTPMMATLWNGGGASPNFAQGPASQVSRGAGANAKGISGDIDGDGDMDVIYVTDTPPTIGIMLNSDIPRLACTSMIDCGQPTYTRAVSPQRNTNIAPNLPPMTWQFTSPVSTATYTAIGATQGPIRIFGMMSGGQRNIAGSGTWSYSMGTTTATFNPARRFLPGEEIMVSMTSAQSPARVNVRPFVYSYRVRAGVGPAIFGNQEFSPYASGSNPQDVALGDVNADGRVDMFTATATGIVKRLNDGTGNFSVNTLTIPTIANPVAITLGDADNDGDLDIAVAGGASISVLLNNGMGVFTTMPGFPLAVGGNVVDIAWGDMNADGDLDLVLADRAGSQIRLVNNNIVTGAFTLGAAAGIAGMPSALAVSDLDNDGDLDVAAANNGGTSGLAIALNDGNGNLSLMSGTPIVTPSAPEGVAVGDLDNDGDNDIALVTTTPDNALIYRNVMGAFTLASTHAVGTSPSDVGLGDVDGDGDLDLISINNGANTATIWKNDGSGFFNQTASGSPYGLGMQPLGVAFADLDGDGDLDFVSANSVSNTTSVMMNQGDAGLAFSLTNAGFTNLFNAGNPTIISRTQTPFTIGSFLGKTNLSNTTATLQYSIQAAAGGNAQFTMLGSTQGTINMASSISTIATFVWRNAPVRGGTTTAVITVSPTFAGLLNATQITVTVIADPAFPRVLAFSQSSSTGTQGVNFGAFNQGQLLTASGRPFNLAFGTWNGWNELAATDATLRLRAFNTQGQEGNFTLNGVPTQLSGIANAATGIFSNLRIVWLNAPETAVSTQVTLRLLSEGPATLSATNVTLTLLREPLEPQITSFSPSTGATGTIVTVRGTGFNGLTGAAIAGVPVQSFTVNSSNQISLVVAAGTSGTIVLINNFGSSESLGTFNFVQYPTLLGIQPTTACAGQVLTITGDNISDVQQVFVGSVPAASFRVNERGQVEAIVPQNADNGIITLQNRAGTAVLNIMLVQTPSITGISPSLVGTGGTLTVTGRNMQFVQMALLFPNTLQILSQSATTLSLRVSTQAQVIAAPLRLESGNGCVVLSTQAISIAAPPTLTAVNITSPEVGQTLVLTGTNFVPGMSVSLGGVTAATIEVVSPTEVRVSFSTNALAVAATGAVLQATTPFGIAILQNTLIRLLPATIIPTNIDFSPETGTLGSTVVITGRGFVDVREVSIGGTAVQSFRVESPSRIVAIVGTGASGIVRVRSTTGTGESMRFFTYLTPQQLDSLAAVNFYRATNGVTWTTSANWLSQQPLSRWFGLTVSQSGANAGRIIGVNLPGNNVLVPAQNGSSSGGGSASSAVSVTNAIVALSQMTALQTVNLSNNTLSGTLGSEVAGLRSVRSLNLANTGLSGRVPVEFGTLDSLEILKLDSNRLDGSLVDVFCTVFGQSLRNYALREIRVAANRLTGEIPPCIVQFAQLQVLRLEDNQFTGKIPEGINRLANLREFVVARNRLSGELPRSLDSTTFAVFAGKQTSEANALTQLEIFDVSNNQLSGIIPNGIAQSRGMKTLLLNNNLFSGGLPQTIPALTALETFDAAQNQLSGELWENVGAMRSLRTFSVRNNRLSGIIPSSFVQIPSLERLELDNNIFAGNAPTEFARMTNLRVLGLSQNRLRTVPSFNVLRQTLTTTRLERNMLTFEGIETSVQLSNLTYSPQDSVGKDSTRFVLVGSPITFNFSVGGAFNRYQWFKNGMAVTDAQESPEFTLTRAALAGNSGVYECRITNSLARDLTLYARPLTIRVDTAEPTNEAVLANQVAAPKLIFPYPAGRNMPYALPLTWQRAIGAVVHEAQFSLLSDFSVLVSNATISSTTLSVSGLRPGTRYYWRVRGIGAEGQRSAWSSDFFTTGINDKPMQMTSIDFGRLAIADTLEGEALVVNFSNVAQTLQEIGLEDNSLSFTILDDVRQVIIPAEKYLTVRVRFSPRSTGVKLATTILRYNESLRPERIDSVVNILQGTGVALKLTDVDFGIVRAGGTTLKSALLINTSPRPVKVQQARARDNDRIFSVEGYLGNREFTIQALDTLLLVVRCSPPNAGRKFNGMLVLGDNDSVRAEIRADARTFKEGDVIMRFGVRPKQGQDSVAPGGLVDMELFGKITDGKTTDLIRAFDNLLQYQARFSIDPNVLRLDTTERRAQQRQYIGVPNRVFVNIPATTFDITSLRNISETNREFVLTSLKGRAVSGSTATTTLEVEQAEWSASAPNLFVEAPINGTFTAKPCEAGGVRLTTTAQPNSVAIARPNPVKDVAEIHYALREDGNIAFSMVDMSGKQVTVLAEGYAEAGEYSMMLDVKAIPSGTYFLVLQTQSGVVRRRVEVVK